MRSQATPHKAIALCGPTASGKSEIAVLVAEAVGGEIVNADSRQVYRDLDVGTGAPPAEWRRRVPHHLFGFVDPCERYSAGAFVRDASSAIAGIAKRGRIAIVTGGTGLYVEALAGTMPMDRPSADDVIRQRVRLEAQIHSHNFLYGWLQAAAPAEATRVTPHDKYRTLRALEAVLATRSMIAQGPLHMNAPMRTIDLRVVLVDVGASTLAERIRNRVHEMYANGLVEEAVAVWRRCAGAPALTGLGFAEALGWFRGEATRVEAVDATIRRTLRYAKRQRTWFRRMRPTLSIDAADPRAAAASIAHLARETAQAT